MENYKRPINLENIKAVEVLPGIFQKTLVYGESGLMCHFLLIAGSKVPIHNHVHVQMGYVISGSLKFSTDKGEFITKSGDSYYFIENERHGADVLEDTEVIDIFMPLREEYIPDEGNYIPKKSDFFP